MSDRDFGLHRRITRRDFLNGIALAIGSTVILPDWAAALLAGDLPVLIQRVDKPITRPRALACAVVISVHTRCFTRSGTGHSGIGPAPVPPRARRMTWRSSVVVSVA